MYRSEKQATQRQNKTSIEEAYFQKPFDLKNYNESTMEYTYEIPQQFAINPSQEKTIGVRRVKLTPEAFKVHIGVLYNDTDDPYVETDFDFLAGNTMIEILHEIADKTSGEYDGKTYKLCWNYDGNELKFYPTFDGKTEGAKATLVSDTDETFFKLFNQSGVIQGFLGTEFTYDSPLILKNVWNRADTFVHASFSNSTNRFICSTEDFYEEISKRFEENTYQSTFKVFYTIDGTTKIAPLSASVLIELSFKIR